MGACFHKQSLACSPLHKEVRAYYFVRTEQRGHIIKEAVRTPSSFLLSLLGIRNTNICSGQQCFLSGSNLRDKIVVAFGRGQCYHLAIAHHVVIAHGSCLSSLLALCQHIRWSGCSAQLELEAVKIRVKAANAAVSDSKQYLDKLPDYLKDVEKALVPLRK